MSRVGRAEIILGIGALVLSVISSMYLIVTLFGAHEICYGVSNVKPLCTPLAPNSVEFAQQSARMAFVLSTVLALYLGATLGAWWQQHTSVNQSTAFGVLATCTALIIGVTWPALTGPGFFLAPSAALMLIAMILGAISLLRKESGVVRTDRAA